MDGNNIHPHYVTYVWSTLKYLMAMKYIVKTTRFKHVRNKNEIKYMFSERLNASHNLCLFGGEKKIIGGKCFLIMMA